MSQENVEIVGRVLRHYHGQDIEAMLSDIDSNIEIDYSESIAPDAAVYQGHAACRAFIESRYRDFQERSFDVTELIDAPPSAVVAVGRMRGRGRASGATVEAESFTAWTVRAGKVSRIKLYLTRDEALKAVGLAE